MLRFDDVITRVITSALKTVHKKVAYQLLIGRGEILGYFCLVNQNWSLKLCDLCNSNS